MRSSKSLPDLKLVEVDLVISFHLTSVACDASFWARKVLQSSDGSAEARYHFICLSADDTQHRQLKW
jgi:hypothetical protein